MQNNAAKGYETPGQLAIAEYAAIYLQRRCYARRAPIWPLLHARHWRSPPCAAARGLRDARCRLAASMAADRPCFSATSVII